MSKLLPVAALACAATLLAGCASGGSGSTSASSADKPRTPGGESVGVAPSEETQHVVMNVREARDLARQSIDLLALFSSNNPQDWARARRGLRLIGEPIVPRDVEALMKITEGTDANKANMARMELARRAKIARILQKLDSKKFEDWQAARFEIQRMGPETVPFLVNALIMEFRGLNQLRYEWARKELIAVGEPAIPYLEGFLLAKSQNADVVLKDQCAITLCQMGPKGKPAIRNAVASPERWTRVAAAKGVALAQARDFTDLLPPLLLKDPLWEVRAETAIAFGKLKDPASVPALTQALKDEDSLVRRQSMKALGEIGSLDAVPALIAVLETEPQSAHSEAALGALNKIAGTKMGPDPGPWKNWYASKTGR